MPRRACATSTTAHPTMPPMTTATTNNSVGVQVTIRGSGAAVRRSHSGFRL
jgi:hypothetical protein